MIRLLASLLIISLPGSALAAGDGLEGAPAWFVIGAFALAFGLPCVGLGYLFQAVMRLRNVVILFAIAAFAFWGWAALGFGLEKALRAWPSFLMITSLFSLLFGLGWYTGTRQTKRHAARQNFA